MRNSLETKYHMHDHSSPNTIIFIVNTEFHLFTLQNSAWTIFLQSQRLTRCCYCEHDQVLGNNSSLALHMSNKKLFLLRKYIEAAFVSFLLMKCQNVTKGSSINQINVEVFFVSLLLHALMHSAQPVFANLNTILYLHLATKEIHNFPLV